jgi:hypothetical protein
MKIKKVIRGKWRWEKMDMMRFGDDIDIVAQDDTRDRQLGVQAYMWNNRLNSDLLLEYPMNYGQMLKSVSVFHYYLSLPPGML